MRCVAQSVYIHLMDCLCHHNYWKESSTKALYYNGVEYVYVRAHRHTDKEKYQIIFMWFLDTAVLKLKQIICAY